MSSFLLKLLVVLGVGYLGICALMFLLQRHLLYFPGPPPDRTPADLSLRFDDLTLETSDGERLQAWHIHAENPRGLVIESHGNAGNMAGRLFRAQVFVELGLDVLLYDYRGYGNSTGEPGEPGLFRDVDAVYAFATGEAGFEASQIVSFGESLGGSVAADLARRQPVAALVLESCFTSVPDMAGALYPWLPGRYLCRDRLDTLAGVLGAKAPTLVMHSPLDEVVPYEQGRRLYEAAGERGEFHELTGLQHNSGGFAASPTAIQLVSLFFDRVLVER